MTTAETRADVDLLALELKPDLTCFTGDEKQATHRGTPPCGDGILVCPKHALNIEIFREAHAEEKCVCQFCGAVFLAKELVLEPLPGQGL